MSISQNPYFTLFDLLTRIIPGGILIATSAYISGFSPSDVPTSPGYIILLLILFYVAGEAIEIVRVRINPVPNYFRRVLYSETGNKMVLTKRDRIRVQYLNDNLKVPSIFTRADQNAWDEFRRQFSVDNYFEDVEEIYNLLLVRFGPGFSRRTRRRQATYVFFKNTLYSSVFGIYMAVIQILLTKENDAESGIAILLLLSAALVAFMAFGKVSEIYINSVFTEYFEQVNK